MSSINPIVCIRDDDVCFFTKRSVLEHIREAVWKDRIITYGVTPYASPSSFQRSLPIQILQAGHVDYRKNVELRIYLRQLLIKGDAEIALHGLAHDDFLCGNVRFSEFEYERAGISERVLTELHRLNHDLEGNVFIPPHNVIHPKIAQVCLSNGFHVCRSLTKGEVDRVSSAGDRHQAKKLYGYTKHRNAMELFQTLIISKQKIIQKKVTVVELLEPFGNVMMEVGIAILTVHWWDFLVDAGGQLDDFFVEFINEFLKRLEAQYSAHYLGLSSAARHLISS